MFCSKCGINLPEDANVCYKCATPTVNNIRQVEPQLVVSTSSGKQNRTQPQVIVKNNSNVGSALVLIALLAGCAFAYLKYKENQSVFSLNIGRDGTVSSNLNLGKVFEPSSAVPTKQNQVSINTTVPNESVSTDPSSCQIVSNSNTVNLRQNCDTNDCENDAGTIAGTISNGESVTISNSPKIQANNYDWIEIEIPSGRYYVASSKLSCFLDG